MRIEVIKGEPRIQTEDADDCDLVLFSLDSAIRKLRGRKRREAKRIAESALANVGLRDEEAPPTLSFSGETALLTLRAIHAYVLDAKRGERRDPLAGERRVIAHGMDVLKDPETSLLLGPLADTA